MLIWLRWLLLAHMLEGTGTRPKLLDHNQERYDYVQQQVETGMVEEYPADPEARFSA